LRVLKCLCITLAAVTLAVRHVRLQRRRKKRSEHVLIFEMEMRQHNA
jgi:hypothetical protein